MATPIKGYEGSVVINDSITAAWVKNWEVNLETTEQDIGPFIGDNGQLYTYASSRRLTGKLEATVPSGRDAGQTALISGAVNSTPVHIRLVTTNGYTITITSGIASNFTMGQDAGETIKLSFDFKSNGTFQVA